MGFWHMFFKKQQFQVLIVGLDYAGKTVSCCDALPVTLPVQGASGSEIDVRSVDIFRP